MSERPDDVSNRPAAVDDQTDVMSDVLQTMRFTTLFFGRFELGAPWALQVPQKPTSSFYVVARGDLRLSVEGLEQPLYLSTGDVVLVPRGSRHALDDGSRRAPAPRDFIPGERLRAPFPVPRLGGAGPVTALVSGCFSFSAGAGHPLLGAFPPAIHLPAQDPRATPALAATVQLIVTESTLPGPGSAIVLGRLADVLLVCSLRMQTGPGGPGQGLRALSDPAVGAALRLMHQRPADPWTVERLASSVGMSRSAFAVRFHELVGETPLRYLAGWRMAKASLWLRETSDSLPRIAERAGYESPAAFSKAFKQWRGVGPAEYRRAREPAPAPPAAAG